MLRRVRLHTLATFLLFCVAVCLSLAAGRIAQAQGTPEAMHRFPSWIQPRYVALEDSARAVLTRDWDRHAKDWPMLERAYCATYAPMVFAGEAAYLVTAITPAVVMKASQASVTFSCQKGQAPVHTHPPQSCVTREGPCEPMGRYSYQCGPSDDDITAVTSTGEPFGLVQCDRFATVGFFPRRP